eukprot:gene31996-33923_t
MVALAGNADIVLISDSSQFTNKSDIKGVIKVVEADPGELEEDQRALAHKRQVEAAYYQQYMLALSAQQKSHQQAVPAIKAEPEMEDEEPAAKRIKTEDAGDASTGVDLTEAPVEEEAEEAAEGRKKNKLWPDAFSRTLPKAIRDLAKVADDSTRNHMSRQIGIWEERRVFPPNFIKSFKEQMATRGTAGEPQQGNATPGGSTSKARATAVTTTASTATDNKKLALEALSAGEEQAETYTAQQEVIEDRFSALESAQELQELQRQQHHLEQQQQQQQKRIKHGHPAAGTSAGGGSVGSSVGAGAGGAASSGQTHVPEHYQPMVAAGSGDFDARKAMVTAGSGDFDASKVAEEIALLSSNPAALEGLAKMLLLQGDVNGLGDIIRNASNAAGIPLGDGGAGGPGSQHGVSPEAPDTEDGAGGGAEGNEDSPMLDPHDVDEYDPDNPMD